MFAANLLDVVKHGGGAFAIDFYFLQNRAQNQLFSVVGGI